MMMEITLPILGTFVAPALIVVLPIALFLLVGIMAISLAGDK
jgi:hypothetical protein